MISPILSRLLSDNPVVVTGLGAFSAAGNGVPALWDAAAAGRSPATWDDFPLVAPGRRLPVCRAPSLEPFRPELQAVRKMDRTIQLGWLAAREAWAQAELENPSPERRTGVILGTSRGPLGKLLESHSRLGGRKLPPTQTADSTFAALGGALAKQFGLNGPGVTVSATCASAAFAIVFAAEQILLGKAEAMLAGGAEAPLIPLILSQFDSAGVLGSHEKAEEACRPFDRSRNGFVLGEGSAFLVLESARSASARGAKVLARLSGWSARLEASGRSGMDRTGDGVVETMKEALALAGLALSDVGYLNAHGTGTKLNDADEAMAFVRLAREETRNLVYGSTKPVTGHCLGTTPALEAVLCIEALRRGIAPPSVNCFDLDPALQLPPPISVAAELRSSHTMSNSIGFWGHRAALVFSRDFS
jgi:3-oxoacyl-[acyl-carrier-protein] synthase II